MKRVRGLVIVQTTWGIPMIARIESDGSGIVVYGMFKGRPIRKSWKVCKQLVEGDVIEDIGLTVSGDKLVAVEKEDER